MRTDSELLAALREIKNMSEFARRHGLSRRTLVRVLAGAEARRGSWALIDAALTAETRAASKPRTKPNRSARTGA